MLGGHLDKKGVVISSVIMVVMIYFGNRIAWSWDAYDALKDQGFTFLTVTSIWERFWIRQVLQVIIIQI